VKRWLATADLPLLMLTLLLTLLGLLMIYSASTYVALRAGMPSDAFLIRQAQAMAIGAGLFFVGLLINPDLLHRYRVPLMVLVIAMLVIVLTPAGKMVNGSRRWLDFKVQQVQPSEFAKLTMIIYLAGLARERRHAPLGSVLNIPPLAGLMIALPVVLIAVETDMGTAMTVALIALVMLVLGGLSLTQVTGIGAACVALIIAVIASGHGMHRVMAWWNPWNDVGGIGYHNIRAFVAFASGGLLGAGFGGGVQKLGYLPEPHTDFIYAVWGEELGLLGTAMLAALFLLLFMSIIRVSSQAADPYHSLLGYGIAFWIISQALINMLVVTGTIPTTGIPLPFISYGGTSLMMLLFGIGLVCNIAQRTRRSGPHAA